MDLKEKVLDYKDEVVKEIQNAVRVRSVKEAPLPGMPFGEGPAKALDHFMDLAKKLGFKAEKFDNYAMHIDMGEGEETLGILAHVDVVPEGDNWTYPPYSGTIADGKIFGRGTLDDKGPAIISLFAMKAIADSGIKLNKKIRMILGADEESGSACLKYYFGELKMPYPDIAFTPDSSFPVTYAEKGSVRVKIKKKFNTLQNVVIKGGNAFNSVPNEAHGIIPVDMLGEVKNKNKVEFVREGNIYKIFSAGIPAHGAYPSKGYNAVSALFEVLKDNIKEGEEVLIPCSSLSREYLFDNLASLGAKCHRVNIYDTICGDVKNPRAFKEVDMVLYTSPSTVKNMIDMIGLEALKEKVSIAIGPITLKALNESGIEGKMCKTHCGDGFLSEIEGIWQEVKK